MTAERGAPPPAPIRDLTDAGTASRARALALCTRARVAAGRARVLQTARAALREDARMALERATALRSLGAARRGPRPAGVPGAERGGPVAHPSRREGGRVVRRLARRVQSAASAAPSPDDPPDAEPPAPPRWAQATVYATRTVRGVDAGVGSDGLPGEPAAAGTWTVREVDAGAMPGAQASRCLVFETHGLVRRVWDFPRAWRSLSAPALFRLAGLHP